MLEWRVGKWVGGFTQLIMDDVERVSLTELENQAKLNGLICEITYQPPWDGKGSS